MYIPQDDKRNETWPLLKMEVRRILKSLSISLYKRERFI
jgi:hypothetical protein